MSVNSFFIVMSIALLVAVLGVYYVLRSQRNSQQVRDKRRELTRRLEALPLPKLMQALGVGIGGYLYRTPVNEIEDAVVLCENCGSSEECAQKRKIPELNPEDVEFCPNRDHLTKYSRAKRIRG